jgi:REP element-mobilizing transposase RayT
MTIPTEYRRRLPHIQPENAVYFITIRLAGTLPKSLIEILNNQLESENFTEKAKQAYFDQIEEFLDYEKDGPTWLKQKDIAQIVIDSLHFYDNKEYKLISYCIMSNHVHFIAYKIKKPLFQVIKNLKTYTATQANKILCRKGRFWQREYFDRMVRDRNDLDQKISYVINNPVKIGLVDSREKWQYNYCHPNFK